MCTCACTCVSSVFPRWTRSGLWPHSGCPSGLAVTAVLPLGQKEGASPFYLTENSLLKCVSVRMFAWAVRHNRAPRQDIGLWFGRVCVCGLWAESTGLLLDDSSAGHECVSSCLRARYHKYSPLDGSQIVIWQPREEKEREIERTENI